MAPFGLDDGEIPSKSALASTNKSSAAVVTPSSSNWAASETLAWPN